MNKAKDKSLTGYHAIIITKYFPLTLRGFLSIFTMLLKNISDIIQYRIGGKTLDFFTHRTHAFFLLLCFEVCLSAIGISQSAKSPFPVTHISVEEGLSQSTVNAICQDAQGFLWFATSDGLDRYDGTAFTIFKHDQNDARSISSNVLAPLALTGDATLWIGTSTGLCRYEKTTNAFSFVPLHSGTPFIPDNAIINKLLTDRNGVLWVGTQNGLTMLRIDTTNNHQDNIHSAISHTIPPERVNSLLEDRTGNIWIGIGKHCFLFNNQHEKITEITIPGHPAIIESMYEDTSGMLWFGTDDSRLLRYDLRGSISNDQSRWSEFPVRSEILKTSFGNFVTSIAEDHQGHLWVGTRLAGLFQFDRVKLSWERFIPPIADQRFEGVTVIVADRSGLLWVGYDGAGIVKINPNPIKFHLLSLPSTSATTSGDNFLKPVIEDHRGRLWIGTYDRGLTMLDRATGERIHFIHEQDNRSGLSNNSLLSLAEDRNGKIWIGTTTGIDCYDEKKKSFRHFNTMFSPSDSVADGTVWSLAVDSLNTIWAGIGNGLLKFDEDKKEFTKILSTDSIKDNWITCIATSADTSIWLGTAKTGILHVNRLGKILANYSSAIPNTLPFNFIKCLSLQPGGILWIGTVEGLCRFDTGVKTWRSYHLKDGLPDESIYGILASDSITLWYSTNRGLVRMNIANPDHPRLRCYTPDDGLQSYEFNSNTYFKAPNGEMFFGGIHGLNTFFPDSVIDNPHKPQIALTAFKKFDQPFNPGQAVETVHSITLDYGESVFSFEFAALEFTHPRRNLYAYKMEGYDREWVQCGNRHEARYTNLDPGNYMFRVHGSNSDGVWNDEGTSIAISIVPPFWRTYWFFAGTVLILAVTFGGGVRYISVRKLRRKLELLEHEKSIEQHRQAIREGIARDLHDEVSSTLSSMSLFVESSKLRLHAGSHGTEGVLSRLHDMAREAEDAMEQAVWSLSPHHQKLSHLLSRIHDIAIEQCQEHQIGCTALMPELQNDFVLSDVVRKNCFLIFRESLANIIRHSHARTVGLSVTISNDTFTMTITDDGEGFDQGKPAPKPRGGNGLKNMAGRAQEIGASLNIQSKIQTRQASGTTVSLTLEIAQMRY